REERGRPDRDVARDGPAFALPRVGAHARSRPRRGEAVPRLTVSAEIKAHLSGLLAQALSVAVPGEAPPITLERPKQAQHGDFSCPVAMQLAKSLKRNPRELAQAVIAALPPSDWVQAVE